MPYKYHLYCISIGITISVVVYYLKWLYMPSGVNNALYTDNAYNNYINNINTRRQHNDSYYEHLYGRLIDNRNNTDFDYTNNIYPHASAWPHILLNYTDHWLLVVDGEHHPHNAYIDIITMLIPSVADPVYSEGYDVNNTYHNPLAYIDNCIQCVIKSVDDHTYYTVPHSIVEGFNYVNVSQLSVPVLRCYTDVDMIDSVQLEINTHDTGCTDPKYKTYNNSNTYNKYHRTFYYKPGFWSTWPAVQQYTLHLPFTYTSHIDRLDLTLCTQPLNERPNNTLLQQYIDYNLYIGFDRIFLYDRTNTLQHELWLQPYIVKQQVEVTFWPYPTPGHYPLTEARSRWDNDQTTSFRHCQVSTRAVSTYVGYFDTDQYITFQKYNDRNKQTCPYKPLKQQITLYEQFSVFVHNKTLGDIWYVICDI